MSEPIPINGPWGQAIDNLKTLTDAQAITIITQNATIIRLNRTRKCILVSSSSATAEFITLEATVTTQNTTIAALDARITVLEP